MIRLATQRYKCQQCGRCCRRFLIPISSLEIEAISKLPWRRASDQKLQCYSVIGGRSYLKADKRMGECVFLEDGVRCRMHASFGSKCKTISCRAYPFEFMRTFDDEITVAARFDCPSIQQDSGENLGYYRIELEEILGDPLMPPLPPPFTEKQLDGLTREAVEAIADFIRDALLNTHAPVPALLLVCRRLRYLGASFLNDLETLKTVLPTMLKKALGDVTADEGSIGFLWPDRVRLRQEMLDCLRYDRQVPDFSMRARLHNAAQSFKFLFGFGNPRTFGPEQPDIPVRRAGLFDGERWRPLAADAWGPYRRFLAAKLESRQFFGAAYYGKGFHDGIDALLSTWKIAVVLARLKAASRDSKEVEAQDMMYATGMIDHIHGRKSRRKR